MAIFFYDDYCVISFIFCLNYFVFGSDYLLELRFYLLVVSIVLEYIWEQKVSYDFYSISSNDWLRTIFYLTGFEAAYKLVYVLNLEADLGFF